MQQLVDLAVAEDIGSGDVTSNALIPAELPAVGTVTAKQELVVCGIDVVKDICSRHAALELKIVSEEGSALKPGDTILTVSGSGRSILTYERVILNFLQRLSGIATLTRSAVDNTELILLDTRKTTPGFRELEKHAVKIGGGKNHRIGLFDKFLIKNNHIDLAGKSIPELVSDCRDFNSDLEVEVEVRNEEELAQAIEAQPDWILLDNHSPAQVADALAKIPSNIKVEVSGGITPNNIKLYEGIGKFAVSMGYLTHSAAAVDISMGIALA